MWSHLKEREMTFYLPVLVNHCYGFFWLGKCRECDLLGINLGPCGGILAPIETNTYSNIYYNQNSEL